MSECSVNKDIPIKVTGIIPVMMMDLNDTTIQIRTENMIITFGGYSENGTVCADGVYLIRVIARGKNLFRNTVYKVGLKG